MRQNSVSYYQKFHAPSYSKLLDTSLVTSKEFFVKEITTEGIAMLRIFLDSIGWFGFLAEAKWYS